MLPTPFLKIKPESQPPSTGGSSPQMIVLWKKACVRTGATLIAVPTAIR